MLWDVEIHDDENVAAEQAVAWDTREYLYEAMLLPKTDTVTFAAVEVVWGVPDRVMSAAVGAMGICGVGVPVGVGAGVDVGPLPYVLNE